MTKFFTAALAAIVSSAALAGTFVVPPNATVTGNADGTVSWSGVSLGSIVHFRDVNAPPVEHKVKGSSGSVKLQDVAANGGRIQLRDTNGNWAWLSPTGTRFNLVGVQLDCSHHDGCAMQVNGTGPKSAPVANYAGGVYRGYAPAQQLASTNQSVGVNTTQMTVAPSGGVVVTLAEDRRYVYSPCHPDMVARGMPQQLGLTCKDDQVVEKVGASQSTGRYKLIPVMTEAEKAGMKKPATKANKAKAPAVAKAVPAKDECIAGKPIETKDGVVQCIPKLLTRIGDAPEAVGASAPAATAPAPTAPATPAAATSAPAAKTAAPAAKKG